MGLLISPSGHGSGISSTLVQTCLATSSSGWCHSVSAYKMEPERREGPHIGGCNNPPLCNSSGSQETSLMPSKVMSQPLYIRFCLLKNPPIQQNLTKDQVSSRWTFQAQITPKPEQKPGPWQHSLRDSWRQPLLISYLKVPQTPWQEAAWRMRFYQNVLVPCLSTSLVWRTWRAR